MPVTDSWQGGGGDWSILVHGGAGDRTHSDDRGSIESTDRSSLDWAEGCRIAVQKAAQKLRDGASALDAAQAAVEVLEDDPRYNAGTGGALTAEGTLELDAAIMEGEQLRAGCVCALPPYRHTIAVARAVLEEGKHVLYTGPGADALARRAGLTPADPCTMITDRARGHLARHLEKLAAGVRPDRASDMEGNTVGAVARDARGHVAAATSTGGTTGQRPGRVGDTPILGAGTYADDHSGAASATGEGEGILRIGLCHQALDALRRGDHPDEAARAAIQLMDDRVHALGGILLAAPDGRLGFARSTMTMPWAAQWSGADLQSGV